MSRRRKPTPQSLYIWEQLERIFQVYYREPENCDRPQARAACADRQRLLDSTYPPSGQAALRAERESRHGTEAG